MRKIYLMIITSLLLLWGCGGNAPVKETTIEENSVPSENEQCAIDSELINSPFKNSKYIFIDDEEGIQQYSTSGEFVKTTKIEGDHRLCFVDENSMFYSIPNDKYDMGTDIYCVSIEDETISHIITEKYGIFYDQFLVYDHYLCYVSGRHVYKEIDIKGNLTVEFEDIHANCELLCMDSTDYIMGDSVFLYYKAKGVYVHTIGTKNMSHLENNQIENLCIYGDMAFYISEDGDLIQVQNKKSAIQKIVKVSQKEIRQAIQKYGIVQDDYYIKELIVSDDKIYVSVEGENILLTVLNN